MPEARHVTVINRPLVESLARQLDLPIDQERTMEGQLGITGKIGASLKTGRTQSPLPLDDPRLLAPIVSSLRDNGQLRIYRPERCQDFWDEEGDWYVHERAIATPVLVPLDETLKSKYTPKALTVWIIDPVETSEIPRHEWDWLGSYVFLVQELGDFPWPARSSISGISALRMITEVIAKSGDVSYQNIRNLLRGEDVFGRWHNGNPLEKLELVGGIRQRPRKIDTIYKIAYMNDEQSAIIDGVPTRINDILAYPLYIIE